MFEALLGGLSIGVIALAGAAINLYSKVNVQEERLNGVELQREAHAKDLKELLGVRFDSLDARLVRIERTMNGALRHE